jgi:hypothetical protein
MTRLRTDKSWLTTQPLTDLRRLSPLRRPCPRKQGTPDQGEGQIKSQISPLHNSSGCSSSIEEHDCSENENIQNVVNPEGSCIEFKQAQRQNTKTHTTKHRKKKHKYLSQLTRPKKQSTVPKESGRTSVHQNLDTPRHKDTLLHGEALLVLPSLDLEDVPLELLQTTGWGYMRGRPNVEKGSSHQHPFLSPTIC